MFNIDPSSFMIDMIVFLYVFWFYYVVNQVVQHLFDNCYNKTNNMNRSLFQKLC